MRECSPAVSIHLRNPIIQGIMRGYKQQQVLRKLCNEEEGPYLECYWRDGYFWESPCHNEEMLLKHLRPHDIDQKHSLNADAPTFMPVSQNPFCEPTFQHPECRLWAPGSKKALFENRMSNATRD